VRRDNYRRLVLVFRALVAHVNECTHDCDCIPLDVLDEAEAVLADLDRSESRERR
jgi:hypothetical protein